MSGGRPSGIVVGLGAIGNATLQLLRPQVRVLGLSRTPSADASQGIAIDVTDEHSVRDAFSQLDEAGHQLDFAVNAFGRLPNAQGPIAEIPPEDWYGLHEVHVFGLWLVLREELRRMKKRRHGAIVNLGSALTDRGFIHSGAYAASKHAALGMSQSAAAEGAAFNVRVNTVSPGIVNTPALRRQLPAHLLAAAPTAQDIAHAIAFFVDPQTRGVSGMNLKIGA